MEQTGSSTVTTILLTLLAGAFCAWAGVVLWAADTISTRLTGIEDGLESVKVEMAQFKLNLSERITKAEAAASRVNDLENDIQRIDVFGARAPNPEYREKVEDLEERLRKLEQHK